MREKRRAYRNADCRRSYDVILKKQIGRTSNRTRKHVQKVGLAIMSFSMLAIILSFLVMIRPGSVEASDRTEIVKDYVYVEIEEGDSLWSVAQKYMSEQFSSMDGLMDEIKEINGFRKDTVLKPGNQIMVPCYKVISAEH